MDSCCSVGGIGRIDTTCPEGAGSVSVGSVPPRALLSKELKHTRLHVSAQLRSNNNSVQLPQVAQVAKRLRNSAHERVARQVAVPRNSRACVRRCTQARATTHSWPSCCAATGGTSGMEPESALNRRSLCKARVIRPAGLRATRTAT